MTKFLRIVTLCSYQRYQSHKKHFFLILSYSDSNYNCRLFYLDFLEVVQLSDFFLKFRAILSFFIPKVEKGSLCEKF